MGRLEPTYNEKARRGMLAHGKISTGVRTKNCGLHLKLNPCQNDEVGRFSVRVMPAPSVADMVTVALPVFKLCPLFPKHRAATFPSLICS